ncbi:DUF6463 family protein [Amycolatopsis suaedae]|uniref:Uncharacterized protein n=1 Tax=Amycolatopsis suaedae TaxID=2510978 RepID=A0A4Q7J1W1_9PSEU|nr:DUF6463 family protein [Amycolatopsis suaedae]RZQ61401.1 hypothetical protein EWH70_23755 [Amycolatopsis suaedae]
MIKWAGWLITLFGAAHTILALTLMGAGQHAGTWFSGGLWQENLKALSPAGSAYWFSIDSFGPAFVLVGLLVLWLARRGITPPAFVGWALIVWTVVDAVVMPLTPWPVILVAAILLLVGIRRATATERA